MLITIGSRKQTFDGSSSERLRRAFEHIAGHRDAIWLTRPGDICAHIESLPEGVVPG